MMDELKHSRTKGSKNGERLYQNEDGTYTELGKQRRREKYEAFKSKAGSFFEQNIKGGKDKPNTSAAEKTIKNTSQMINDATDLTNAISNIRSRNSRGQNATSSMTDTELREAINRLRMEREYADLTTKETSKGMQIVKDVLSIAGPTVAIVGGIVGTAATIRTWNKK